MDIGRQKAEATRAPQARRALLRWVQALNTPGDAQALHAAADQQIHVRRHGNDGDRGRVLEWFDGLEAVSGWIARSPEGLVFSLAGAVEPDPGVSEDIAASQRRGEAAAWPTQGLPIEEGAPAWRARYRVVVGDFEGGGWWRFDLSADERIGWLEHIPDELQDRYRMHG